MLIADLAFKSGRLYANALSTFDVLRCYCVKSILLIVSRVRPRQRANLGVWRILYDHLSLPNQLALPSKQKRPCML